MRCCKSLVCVCLFLLAVVPAYCQRGTFGIDIGQTSDTFAGLPTQSTAVFLVDGEFAVIKSNLKTERPAVVAGGEARFPEDALNHAKEFALYGGVHFKFMNNNLTIGVDGQVRKIYMPTAFVNNQFFDRDNMGLFELPILVRYKFGSARRAFIEAKGAPEFTPHFRASGAELQLPHPNFDHGYFIQGSAGYVFGRWYVKGTYENRYFKFEDNQNNPSNLYNWRTNRFSAGIGVSF